MLRMSIGARKPTNTKGMLKISHTISLTDEEVEITAIRAQGSGGQNVNKVSSAIHLRFDIPASSLPETVKQRLLSRADRRINKQGIIVIKAQNFRTREKNLQDALERLRQIILPALHKPKRRIPTRPSTNAKKKRLDQKVKRGRQKALRRKVFTD